MVELQNLKAPVMEKVTRVRLVLDPKSGPLGYLPYLSPLPLRPSHYCRCLSHGSHPAPPAPPAPPPPHPHHHHHPNHHHHHHPNHPHHQPHNCLDSWLICFIRAPPPAFESSHVTAQISFLFFLILLLISGGGSFSGDSSGIDLRDCLTV